MRVAAIYDIHGNLPALEAVLRDVDDAGVDAIVVGGDVLPGPMPAEVFQVLLGLRKPVYYLRGNGDREVLNAMQGRELTGMPEAAQTAIRWTARELPPRYAETLASWPDNVQLRLTGLGPVLFCHATPRNDHEIFTQLTPEERVMDLLAGVQERLVICGHTHMQFDRMVGQVRVVNAGSVGMPFAEPGAYWALLGDTLQLRKTEYDLIAAAGRIRRTNYPGADQFAEKSILSPPSEAAMLDFFRKAELK